MILFAKYLTRVTGVPVLFLTAVAVMAGEVSEELAERHADAYTDQWKDSSPDLAVYIPDADRTPRSDNQHFIVFPLKDGTFFAVWTRGSYEGSRDMGVVFSKSTDRGLTWTKPETITGARLVERDGKKESGGRAVWGFPVYVPQKQRIYVFYGRELVPGISTSESKGQIRFKLTEDEGTTWSKEYVLADKTWLPRGWTKGWSWIIWQRPVEITPGQIIGCGTIWRFDKALKTRNSEVRFWRFDNILTQDDPAKLRVTLLPDGDAGIRMSAVAKPGSVAEEPTVVRLSDGRWFCVFRTFQGCVGYSVSNDQGHTWAEAKPLRYTDDGQRVLQPQSSCPLYALADGRFMLVFNNNDGTANGGTNPLDWRRNRRPAFCAIGKEMLGRKQPVWFTPPVLFLDNNAKPLGRLRKTEIATYPSFFEYENTRYFWYPDRKHFLLGKLITDEMLARAQQQGPW